MFLEEVKSLVVIQNEVKILTPAHTGCLMYVQIMSNVIITGNIKITLPKAFEKIQILVQIFPVFPFILSSYYLPYWLLGLLFWSYFMKHLLRFARGSYEASSM